MVTYRQMCPEDVPFISRLEEETFSMPWSPDDFLDMIRKGSEGGFGILIVTFQSGQICFFPHDEILLDYGDLFFRQHKYDFLFAIRIGSVVSSGCLYLYDKTACTESSSSKACTKKNRAQVF